ncbi:hypothetical protein R1flu_006264 [Riccia fluitans]|uniref:Centromere/kinetochore protein zw10-like protein n=1 Tax=Riccia fluitans TaxID=41844 RepID=A0ABD1YVT9_9MARC
MGIPAMNSTLKELLPHSNSGKIDESAFLSASDLITLLDRIRIRSEGIKEMVLKTVTTYEKEFKGIISQADRTAADVQSVSDELQAVLELFGGRVEIKSSAQPKESGNLDDSNHFSSQRIQESRKEEEAEGSENVPVDIGICNLASQIHDIRNRIREREDALVVVNAISSLFEQLQSTEQKFTPKQLVEAADNMRYLQRKLRIEIEYEQQFTDEYQDVKPFKLLQDAWRERFQKLASILENMFAKAIVIKESSPELCITSPVDCEGLEAPATVELSAIFKAMDVIGVLDAKLAILGDAVHKHILIPILRDPSLVVSTTDVTSSLPNSRSSLTLRNSVSQVDKGQNEDPVSPLYSRVAQVIRFLHKNIFGNQAQWMARFGRLFWPTLAETIISGCLSKAVPSETSQLKEFHKIADVTKNFEIDLANEGLIPNFDRAKGDKLSNFAADVEVHFASKKKKQVLALTRDMIMQTDYVLSESSWGRSVSHRQEDSDAFGDRSVFRLQNSCAVSSVARKLVALIHNSIEDACLATPRTAVELYHASRDAIQLYRALIPVKLGLGLSNLSQGAALCHNDCLYIAHELLTFFYQYGDVLTPPLREVFTFVDLVLVFRRLANELLNQQISIVHGRLMMRLDQAQGFQRTDEKQQYEITQQSLRQVFAIFNNLATLWRPVLSQKVYKKVVSGLIENVVSRIVFEVLAIDDIALRETVQLQEILRFVEESFPPFLAPPAIDEISGDQAPEEENEPMEKSVPSWRKLGGLLNLLDMSLVAITQAWESGDLTSRGFSATEVQKFIKAIFSETALRQECLLRIVPIF